MAVWRLIQSVPAPGSFNMALDEALLHCCSVQSPVTLRFYQWSPTCVSIGYFQQAGDIDHDKCRRLGIELVRRPTGGRAILHEQELTYSVAGPLHDPTLSGSVNESYHKIAGAVQTGLRILGVDVQHGEVAHRERQRSGACFESVWGHELTAGGRKLVASAQTRNAGAVLQHGSILLEGGAGRLASVLTADKGAQLAANLSDRSTSLSAILQRPVAFDEVASALKQGFERALGVSFEAGQPTGEEIELAQELAVEKYNSPEWTSRK